MTEPEEGLETVRDVSTGLFQVSNIISGFAEMDSQRRS